MDSYALGLALGSFLAGYVLATVVPGLLDVLALLWYRWGARRRHPRIYLARFTHGKG